MSFAPGTALGRYQILDKIGEGGMGEVYRARDPRLDRDVAVKILSAAVASDPGRFERFEREARAVAALSHPHVLAVFDVGSEDVPYLVTELLEGETLRAELQRGPMPLPRVINIALQLLSGLAAAHARGIIHRDLKPENIFITREAQVKILDFGLAKSAVSTADVTAINATAVGLVVGTVGYMAPEQARGEAVDVRTDLFAVGTILFEMLTGQRAFHGASPADTLTAVLHSQPRDLSTDSGVPPSLARIIGRCLEKRPDGRFGAAQDLRFAIESLAGAARTAPQMAEKAVAVLPFANMSTDPENQYFSDGLSEELINALTRLPGLRVASRTSAFRFRGGEVDIREIGRQLSVTHVLEGSVRRAGSRLRVSAQLISVADGYHVWSERYDRELADVFVIQDEIVEAIVKALAPALLGDARAVVPRRTDNLEAYELYLKGRHFWHQRSPSTLQAAIRCFEQVIALDPEYTLAHAAMADCYAIYRVYGWYSAAKCREGARPAVARAMALDPSLAEVHYSQAIVTYYLDRNWRGAIPHLQRALEINPRLAIAQAYMGLVLATDYRFDEAIAERDAGLALDPLSPFIHYLCATTALVAERIDDAIVACERVLELQPDSLLGYWPLALSLAQRGRHEEAIAAAERAVVLSRSPFYVGILGSVYVSAGRAADAESLRHELDERHARGEYVSPSAPLLIAVALNDLDRVRAEIRRCIEDETPPLTVMATSRAALDALRGDPEIDGLLDILYDGARPRG